MTLVSVMEDKFRRSWPQLKSDKPLRSFDVAVIADLGKAVERPYRTDAHFVPYRTPNGHRLNFKVFEHGVTVEMTAVVFDVDGAGHAATEEWRHETRQRVVMLAEVHPNPYYYETRGGCRIVYAQEEPTIIDSAEAAREWSQNYHVGVAYLARRFGIVADPACSDWQRSYRLPRATRDPERGPENRPSMGDPDFIGDLFIDAGSEDVEMARRAFRKQCKQAPITRTSAYRGNGLFYTLLWNRGHVDNNDAPRGGWICLCPNRAEHTIDTDWTDTTIVVPPEPGQELGLIVCLHGHCRNRFTVPQWLRFFSDAERSAARERAGLRGKAA